MGANAHMNFELGEGINHADFTDGREMLIKAIDDRRYMYGAALALDPSDYAQNYAFGGSQQLVEGAWTAGITTSTANRNVNLAPGMLWLNGGGGSAPQDLGDTEHCFIGLIWGGETVTLAASSGGDRWHLLSIPRESLYVAGGSESRDFMDAVTRALSSQSVDKRVTAAPVLTVTVGAYAGGVPATPSGHAALAAVKIRNGAAGVAVGGVSELYTDVIDYTSPIWRRHVGKLGREGLYTAGDWAPENTIQLTSQSAASKVAYWYPGDHAGDPSARLLGVCIKHDADEAFTAELVRVDYETGADVVLSTITVGTTDGADRQVISFGNGTLPIWCNGTPGGRAIVLRGIAGTTWDGSTLALKITSGAGAGAQTTRIAKVDFFLATC